jgi:RimJ/RimL family protein N-acetyltransferase
VVEIGYSILPAYHRRGYATEAAAGLARSAFLKGVKVIAAHTLAEDRASGGVLLNNGFRMVGPGAEQGTARFEITRAEWQGRATPSLTV